MLSNEECDSESLLRIIKTRYTDSSHHLCLFVFVKTNQSRSLCWRHKRGKQASLDTGIHDHKDNNSGAHLASLAVS